jgi:hypothetical protein
MSEREDQPASDPPPERPPARIEPDLDLLTTDERGAELPYTKDRDA